MALLYLIILCGILTRTDGTCVFPSNEWNGTWLDSRTGGDIILSSATKQMTSGWTVTAYASSVTSWTCQISDVNNRLLLFSGDQNIDLFGAPQNSYLCVKWTKITDYSYYYYLMAKEEVNAGSDRVFIEDGSVPMGSIVKYCTSVGGPGIGEYHVITKSGHESDVKQYCPIPLMGTFWYTYTDGTTTKCGQNSEMDVCQDRMSSTFSYQNCSENVAYTQEGYLYCINHIKSGDTYFASLLNPGTVDNSNYFRFVCMVMTSTATDVKVSISHGSCQKEQKSTVVPSGGGKAILNPRVLCRPCDPDPCYNGGTCTLYGVDYSCACVTGYSGDNCTIVDPCIVSSPCQNGGTCNSPSNGTYECTCSTGFTGTDCEHEIPCVLSNPCENGGTCQTSGLTYTCACASGYSGRNCSWIDPCILSSPCQNGATCSNNATAVYFCSCAAGYDGTDCEHELPCFFSNYCENGGTCSTSGLYYTCACATGYSGTNCSWSDPCILTNPCYNGATCNNPSSNSYTCSCASGYYGGNCQNSDPCTLQTPCKNGATCSNPTSGVYNCACAYGYSGNDCEHELPCVLSNPCENGGTCQATGLTYNCACATGYRDINCTYSDPCTISGPCQNGGSCQNTGSGLYSCSCIDGYYGNDCENTRACKFPSKSWEGKWIDSRPNDDVKFVYSSAQVIGWSEGTSVSNVTSWTCILEDKQNNIFVFKGDNNVTLSGVLSSLYLCMKWTQITEFSYYYYLYTDVLTGALNNKRIHIEDAVTPDGNISKYCSPQSSPPSSEFNIIVKDGNATTAKQKCATPFLGKFYYSFVSGNVTSCQGNETSWDVCTSRDSMAINYNLCSTRVAFTDEGLLLCMMYIKSGSVYYLSTFNPGVTDNVKFYRFSCFTVSSSGSVVSTSFRPGSCDSGMTATAIPSGGGTATLTPYVTCPDAISYPPPQVSSGSMAGFIVAVVVILLALFLLMGSVCVYKKIKSRKDYFHDHLATILPVPRGQTVAHSIFLGKRSTKAGAGKSRHIKCGKIRQDSIHQWPSITKQNEAEMIDACHVHPSVPGNLKALKYHK